MTSEPLLIITGTVATRDDATARRGAVASVKLVDSDGEVLAATAVPAERLPVSFTLQADPAFQTATGSLLLWAALRADADLWGTADLVPVTGDVVDLVLDKIED